MSLPVRFTGKEKHEITQKTAVQLIVNFRANFGADHHRYANLLRRFGRIEEAIEQFQRTMTYAHRYFPEFMLPCLASIAAGPGPAGDALESLMRLVNGDHVVFWQGRYYAVPERDYPLTGEALSAREVKETGFAEWAAQSPSAGGLMLAFSRVFSRLKRPEIRVADVMANLERGA